jgi:NCS1 family nucleobase:cation symporter-1
MTGKIMWFYDYGWFTGSILGGVLYYFVARRGDSK